MEQTSELSQASGESIVQVRDVLPESVTAFARCEDFRRVFLENLDSFYQLCFLLTRDHAIAEECFICALDECVKSQQVSKERERAWSRRTLVQNAVAALQPAVNRLPSSDRPRDGLQRNLTTAKNGWFEIVAVLSLDDFERFVFVLTVLDQFSDWDCAFLLGSPIDDVTNARTRALEQLGSSSEGAPEATF
jgi:DNA-directed RNA polymerase specialized sigma24 family protein